MLKQSWRLLVSGRSHDRQTGTFTLTSILNLCHAFQVNEVSSIKLVLLTIEYSDRRLKRADYNFNQSLEQAAYRPRWASTSGEHN